MKSFWRLLQYINNYKGFVALNIISNVLTAIFTVVSIPLLIPFLQVLFDRATPLTVKPEWAWDVSSMQASINYWLGEIIAANGKEAALAYVCIGILAAFFLKNLFRYLSLFFMAPVRNGIIRDMRA